MSVQVKISLAPEAAAIIRNVETMPQWMGERIGKAMFNENEKTVAHIKTDYLSFPRSEPPVPIGCRVQSNRLRGSLDHSLPAINGNKVTSAIGSNLVYAPVQEFGATIPARPSRDKRRKGVMLGERVITGRGFVQRGIADRAPNYIESISAAIVVGWSDNGTK